MTLRVAWIASAVEGTKSTYCSEVLLPLLEQHFEILRYVPSGEGSVPYARPLDALSADARGHCFDRALLQVEDGVAAEPLLECLSRLPGGVVWIHDTLFSSRAVRGEDPFPGELRCQARALLFSCERNLAEYRRRVPSDGTRTAVLPYPVVMPPPSLQATLPPLLCFCGEPIVESQIHVALEALSGVRLPYRLKWLIDPSERFAAEALLQEFNTPACQLLECRSPEAWQAVVSEGGLALHLRVSAYGDPGPYLPISLGAGATVVVSDYSSTAAIPDAVVSKVLPGQPGLRQLRSIFEHFLGPTTSEFSRRAAAGRTYAAELHDARLIASELGRVLRQPSVGWEQS
ncbi:MAG: hypothetical protein KDD69_03730 [Bdellovibrionales bacterium]|nr:hypothetical protein [Bdellovibrionales bacterium]